MPSPDSEATVSVLVNGKVIYSGKTVAVPREGDSITLNGKAVRVEHVTWDFGDDGSNVSVTVEIADRSYTF